VTAPTPTVDDLIARSGQTWAGHRMAYELREQTWRETPDQRRAAWEAGCGWCGHQLHEHPAEPSTAEWKAAFSARYADDVEYERRRVAERRCIGGGGL
jgi:hypothetical protein